MTQVDEDNWEDLKREWQRVEHPVPDPATIRRRMKRKRTRLFVVWVMDTVLGVGLLALVIREFLERPSAATFVLLTGVGAFVVIAIALSVVNRRGLWAPDSTSLEDYVRHGLEHCRRRLRTVVFSWWLFAAEVLFIAGYGIGVGFSVGAWMFAAGFLAAFTVAFAAWTFWFRRRVLLEREYLESLDPGSQSGSHRARSEGR